MVFTVSHIPLPACSPGQPPETHSSAHSVSPRCDSARSSGNAQSGRAISVGLEVTDSGKGPQAGRVQCPVVSDQGGGQGVDA